MNELSSSLRGSYQSVDEADSASQSP